MTFSVKALSQLSIQIRDKVGAQSSQGASRTIREREGPLEHDSALGWPELPLAGPQFIMACRGIQGDQGL